MTKVPFGAPVVEEGHGQRKNTQALVDPLFPVLGPKKRCDTKKGSQRPTGKGPVLVAHQIVETGDQVVVVLAIVLSGVGEEDVVDVGAHGRIAQED